MARREDLFHNWFKEFKRSSHPYGVIVFSITLFLFSKPVMATDGAAEALELRVFAEKAIADEMVKGDSELAGVMKEILPGMLVDHLVTRDETIVLDTVGAAFIEQQFGIAAAMEEPGVAMALDVFAGPGTGYEHGIRTSIAHLADFQVKHALKASRVSDRALDVHERVIQQHMAKLDKKLEQKIAKIAEKADRDALKRLRKLEQNSIEAADLADMAADLADKAADMAADLADKAADEAADLADDAADDAADEAEDKADKDEDKGKDKDK